MLTLQELAALPPEKAAAVEARARWLAAARPKQIPSGSEWAVWLALAGRGFGKTRAGAEDTWWYAARHDGVRVAVVAPTLGDLRRTCFEGESGLVGCVPKACLRGNSIDAAYNRSLFELHLWNGSVLQGYSADTPDRLRGPNFHRAWADEVGSWEGSEAWDMLQMTLRLGQRPQLIITTTPRPSKLIKSLIARVGADVKLVRGSTYENEHLAPGFLAAIRDRYEGTRLGRQELHAEILEDIEGALWARASIDATRISAAPELARIVVAVDPAVTSSEGADETGIVVAGKGVDGRAYVLGDLSCRLSPDGWARRAVRAFHEHKADRLVAEVNQGGDLVERVMRTVDANVAYKAVRASKGKVTRAEPVAALYEQGKVSHVGVLPGLEDQMCSYTPTGFDGSPDRVDALVWALTELMLGGSEFAFA